MSVRGEVLTSLAERVAESLPGEWTVTPFPEDWGRAGAYLKEARSQAILILGESQEYSDRNKNKITISGDYPKDRSGNTSQARRPKITVSGEKTGSQIARDITRRLLPEYLPLLERELEMSARWTAHEDRAVAVAEQIARLVRVERQPRETSVHFYKSPYKIFQGTMSRADVVGDDEVELSLRLDSRTALNVLNLIIHGQMRLPEGVE